MATASGAHASGSQSPTPSNDEFASYSPVTDGNTDIAETLDGERMKVQAPGRHPMQRVYLWKGNINGKNNTKGLTNIPYDTTEDGPVMHPVGHIPSAQELLPSPDVVQYLEVGIVIGDDPHRFKPAPNADKKNRDDRKQRGDMLRHTSAIRVFIPIMRDVVKQAKYYVGVKPVDGYLQPRTINSECVFFYPEFWTGIEKATKKERRAFMFTRMKQLAVSTQPQDEHNIASIAAMDETASPEMVDGPLESTPGVDSFFDFDTELGLEDAESVVHELNITTPFIVDIVQATHHILREHELGDRLPYGDLSLFLEVCNNNILSNDIGEEVMA